MHYFSSCNGRSRSKTAVYTNKNELDQFLNLLDKNSKIQRFLHYDSTFRLADKYLIAMVFIYFKRAKLTPEDYTDLNFFAGLCLAHSMEEDIDLSCEIYPWALESQLKNHLHKLIEIKILLWKAMDHRAAVSHHCCQQLLSISKNHPIWQRDRSPTNLTKMSSSRSCVDCRCLKNTPEIADSDDN